MSLGSCQGSPENPSNHPLTSVAPDPITDGCSLLLQALPKAYTHSMDVMLWSLLTETPTMDKLEHLLEVSTMAGSGGLRD